MADIFGNLEPDPVEWYKALELEQRKNPTIQNNLYQCSQAISLKRIADILEKAIDRGDGMSIIRQAFEEQQKNGNP